MTRSRLAAASITAALALAPAIAHADPPSPPVAPPPSPAAAPTVGTPALQPGQHFTIDPVVDGVLIAGGAGFAGLLGLVLSTGEVVAQSPGPASNLLSFDRGAVTQTIDPHAGTFSDIGLYTAVGFAALDPLLSGLRDGWDAGLVDAVLYAETVALTETLTDITKIAVRRPRPVDYMNCPFTNGQPSSKPGCGTDGGSTDLALSFFSGHAATVGSIGATATYLSFVRDPNSVRPWLTLGASVALTSFVSYERVRSGEHFPTDVIAGSMAGAAIGVLVPHLHRHHQEAPPVWIGGGPSPGGGGSITVGALF